MPRGGGSVFQPALQAFLVALAVAFGALGTARGGRFGAFAFGTAFGIALGAGFGGAYFGVEAIGFPTQTQLFGVEIGAGLRDLGGLWNRPQGGVRLLRTLFAFELLLTMGKLDATGFDIERTRFANGLQAQLARLFKAAVDQHPAVAFRFGLHELALGLLAQCPGARLQCAGFCQIDAWAGRCFVGRAGSRTGVRGGVWFGPRRVRWRRSDCWR